MANSEKYQIQIVIDGKNQTDTAINKTTNDLSDLEKGTNRAASGWDNFKGAASTALGALAVAGGVAAAVAQVNSLGRANIAAETTFNQVSGGVENANGSLARMRQLTGGVIADIDLMKGANSLLVTGIAQTNEQAEELVNLGSRLGAVMGVDAAESIQNLNSALLNNSFLRLDTLGISAARVRERVNELKESGLDMSAAFSQAVLEIGGQTLEDLGVAAGVAENAIARLTIRAQNFGTEMAEGVARGLETAAISLEQLIALTDIAFGGTGGVASLEATQAAAEQAAAEYAQLIAIATQFETLSAGIGGRTTDYVNTSQVAAYSQARPDQFAQASSGSYFADAISAGDIENVNAILSDLFGVQSNASIEQLQAAASDLDATFLALAQAQEVLATETAKTNQAQLDQARSMTIQDGVLSLYNRTLNQMLYSLDDIQGQAGDFYDTLNAGTISTQGMTFFDPDSLATAQIQAEAIVDEYERLKALGESSEFTLVSEEEVERARIIAESATETATQSERNARAWESASLAQIAGATSGGRANEFNQGVLAMLSPEQQAQAEQMLNLQSGVETANTLVVEYAQALNAAIFDEFGTAAGVRAAATIQTALEDGIAQGFEGERLQSYIEEQVGFAIGTSAEGGTSVSGQNIQVQAGEGYLALAQRTGIAREDIEAATGGRMLQAGEIITVGDNQLIALDSGSLTESLSSAIGNVLGNISSASLTAQSDYGGGATMPDYTYYDPATGTYDTSNQSANTQAAAVGGMSAEFTDNVSLVSDDMLSIEDSFLNISQSDVSPVLDPLLADATNAQTGMDDFTKSLEKLSKTQFGIEIPIEFVFDNVTAEILSRNSSVVEVFKLVLPMLGVETQGG